METHRPVVRDSASGRRLLLRGESVVALVGIGVAGVFLAAMAGSLWWTFKAQRDFSRTVDTNRLRAVGESLARTTEALLAAGEVSALRCVIATAGLSHNLDSCRVVLPDGEVIADADPSKITLAWTADSWSDVPSVYEESLHDGKLSLNWPLEILGRGRASLEMSATIVSPAISKLGDQTGLGIMAAAGLTVLLLIYRRARSRFRGIGAVREALLTIAGGQKSSAALEVGPELGPEADAWNELLAEREDLTKQIVLGKVKEALQDRDGTSGDLGAVCDALSQGLIVVDADKQVKYANGAAAVFLQTRREELLGANLAQFVKDEKILEAIHIAATGPTSRRNIFEVEQDGSAGGGVLRFIIRPVRREDTGVAMIVIEDITQKRVAEEARNTFLAQATHELRTPLTNIRLYVETALVDGDDDPAVRAKALNVINEESRRLERIVSDILSVSEIEAGSFKIERDDVRLDVLLEQLKADYEPQAAEKQIKLTFDLPPKLPVLQADRDKVALALHNLIGNALKYTPKGGRVTVHVTVAGSRISIEVTDTGIGINPAETEKIFEKFYRAKNVQDANITGSGMGLTLAREVIRLHGGDIVVRSEPDKGSSFTLMLPLSEEAV